MKDYPGFPTLSHKMIILRLHHSKGKSRLSTFPLNPLSNLLIDIETLIGDKVEGVRVGNKVLQMDTNATVENAGLSNGSILDLDTSPRLKAPMACIFTKLRYFQYRLPKGPPTRTIKPNAVQMEDIDIFLLREPGIE